MKKLVLVLMFFIGRSALAQSLHSPSSSTFAYVAYQCSYKGSPGSSGNALGDITDIVDQQYARGYCFGVLTTAGTLLVDSGDLQPTSANRTFDRMREVIANYLKAHPEESQGDPSLTLKKILKQEWGIQKKNSP